MGISGLLPLLKSIHKPCRLDKFRGQTLGIDAYGWLHRGTVACAVELALDKPTTKYVDFAMSRVRMLIHFGIKPYLVFDGDYLPSKAVTEKDRAARRKEARETGLRMLKQGRSSDAYLELQKAVDVTPEMARLLIEELKKVKVEYVVAPYEADSQLAFLEKEGHIDGIVSEDSDLLVFGAKILITKLDQYGECVMIRRDDFTACRAVSLVGWTDVEFRCMAILSGCDYLENINKMGLKTAHRLIRKHKTIDRLVRSLQFDGQYKVPKDYLKDFEQAERTFLHQWVFCPLTQALRNYNPLPAGLNLEDLPYLGQYVEPSTAAGVAMGDLNPHTKQLIKVLPRSTSLNSFHKGKENVTSLPAPDVKKTRSINTFFKPVRMPLAELDPNILPLTPSQRRLLEHQRHNGSWSASLAPPSASSRLTQTEHRRASVPARLSRSISTPSAGSMANPSKRRRILCDDELVESPSQGRGSGTEARSKFFISAKCDRPEQLQKSPNRTNEINLWSDDSIEDALSKLPDPSTGVQEEEFSLLGARMTTKHAISIFEDGAHVLKTEDSHVSAISCPNTVRDASQKSSFTSQDDTQATSVGCYESGRCIVPVSPVQPQQSRGELSMPQGVMSKFVHQEDLAPRVDSPFMDRAPKSIPLDTPSLPRKGTSFCRAGKNGRSSSEVAVAGSSPVQASVRGRQAHEKTVTPPKGSEDLLLVPDSEDELADTGETEDGHEVVTPVAAKFDLRRFAFTTG